MIVTSPVWLRTDTHKKLELISDTFSPVANLTSVQVLLAVTVAPFMVRCQPRFLKRRII